MMRSIAMAMMLIVALLVTTTTPGQAQEVKRMTVEELRERLTEPNLLVIDVRTGRDWTGSKQMIKGAKREEPGKIDWAKNYTPGQTLVLYCTWPNEGTSARVARQLLQQGFTSVYALEGGWQAWQTAGYPTEAK